MSGCQWEGGRAALLCIHVHVHVHVHCTCMLIKNREIHGLYIYCIANEYMDCR